MTLKSCTQCLFEWRHHTRQHDPKRPTSIASLSFASFSFSKMLCRILCDILYSSSGICASKVIKANESSGSTQPLKALQPWKPKYHRGSKSLCNWKLFQRRTNLWAPLNQDQDSWSCFNALWVKPHLKGEIKNFAKWVPRPPFLVVKIVSDKKYLGKTIWSVSLSFIYLVRIDFEEQWKVWYFYTFWGPVECIS